jgi:hypothetical protein
MDVPPVLDGLEQLLQRVEALDHVELSFGLGCEEALVDRALQLTLRRADGPEELPLVDHAEIPPADEGMHARRDWMEVEQQAVRGEHAVAFQKSVHDALRLESSQRPGEEDEVEATRRLVELDDVTLAKLDLAP